MTFATKLKTIRKQAGFSQEQLAEKLRVSRQAVTKWETDGGLPDIANIVAISALFKISLDALLSDEIAAESPKLLYESVTEYDIGEIKKFDMKFGAAKRFTLCGYDGEKIRVCLASQSLINLQNDFKVRIDDGKKRIDLDVVRNNEVTEAVAKEEVIMFVTVPTRYADKIECSVNAESVEVRSLKCDVELDVKTPNLIMDGVAGRVEINCNLDMNIVCHSFEGAIELNQISSTSKIYVPGEAEFSAVARGINTKIVYENEERIGKQNKSGAKKVIELNGVKSELMICTLLKE